MYLRIETGDLMKDSAWGKFDVIAHCVNCCNTQKSGIAVDMVRMYNTDKFPLEETFHDSDYNKLGQIQFVRRIVPYKPTLYIHVVNMYGQYHWKKPSPYGIPLDYDALRLCFRKVNDEFEGKHLGLPGLVGCGRAQGDKDIVMKIIEEELKKVDVTIIYPSDDVKRFNNSRTVPPIILQS